MWAAAQQGGSKEVSGRTGSLEGRGGEGKGSTTITTAACFNIFLFNISPTIRFADVEKCPDPFFDGVGGSLTPPLPPSDARAATACAWGGMAARQRDRILIISASPSSLSPHHTNTAHRSHDVHHARPISPSCPCCPQVT